MCYTGSSSYAVWLLNAHRKVRSKMLVQDARGLLKEQAAVPLFTTRPVTFPKTDSFLPSDVKLRQIKIKSEVKRGNVEHVLPMIVKFAHRTYDHFPAHVKTWYDIEDLIADGIGLASTTVLKGHSGKKAAGYVTYLYKSLDNLRKDRLKELFTDKRFVRGVYSIDSTNMMTPDRRIVLMSDLIKTRRDRFVADEERLIQRIDSERAFIKLYAQSSPALKRYLIMWLIQPTETKFKLYGGKFLNARDEFRALSPAALMLPEHCRCVWQDLGCKKNICRQLIQKFRTPLRPTTETVPLSKCVERFVGLFLLLSSKRREEWV
jgi:hypothetical protein